MTLKVQEESHQLFIFETKNTEQYKMFYQQMLLTKDNLGTAGYLSNFLVKCLEFIPFLKIKENRIFGQLSGVEII